MVREGGGLFSTLENAVAGDRAPLDGASAVEDANAYVIVLLRASSHARRDGPTCAMWGFMCFVIRSVRISRCEAERHGPFRNGLCTVCLIRRQVLIAA